MTVAETARAVAGAGSWVEGGDVLAFRVGGAVARDEVALLLDFEQREDLVFQGFFVTEDELEGVLSGGGVGQVPLSFIREDLLP